MTEENNQAVAKAQPKTVRELVQSDAFKSAVSTALPTHMKAERFIRVALTAITRTPELQNCDQGSLFNCLLTLSQYGLEPDGRNAHLIPFGKSCTLILDYKGLVDLVMRSGLVANIHADKVCPEDEFTYDRGAIQKHVINFQKDRGEAYAYYVIVRFKDGTEKTEVMTRAEVEKVRARSKAGRSGPWVTDFDEMGKKTVFRRASKWLRITPELAEAFDRDDDKPIDITHDVDVSPSPLAVDTLAKKRGRKPKVEENQEAVDGVPVDAATVEEVKG